MIIASLQVIDIQQTQKHILEVQHKVDGFELRLDYLNSIHISIPAIKLLKNMCQKPIIITLRSYKNGGNYLGSEKKRLKSILLLAELNPEYIDLESHVPEKYWIDLNELFPKIQCICSYHHFSYTPRNLPNLFKSIQNPYCTLYKIATFAQSIDDTSRMIHFTKEFSAKHRLIGICMGKNGRLTRTLSPLIGNAMHYVASGLEHMTAPGQITLEEFLTIYKE